MVLQFTQHDNTGTEQTASAAAAQESLHRVSLDIRVNQRQLKEVFGKSQDIVFREFAIPQKGFHKCTGKPFCALSMGWQTWNGLINIFFSLSCKKQ